jgi:site-specific DNA recombinase
LIDHVTIGRAMIEVQLSDVAEGNDGARTLTLPWRPPSPYRRREIIQGASNATTCARPMRADARAILIKALGNAHRWLDALLSDPRRTLESLALREGKTERSIRMIMSLAFLAPDIVKAAIEGRLPRHREINETPETEARGANRLRSSCGKSDAFRRSMNFPP